MSNSFYFINIWKIILFWLWLEFVTACDCFLGIVTSQTVQLEILKVDK